MRRSQKRPEKPPPRLGDLLSHTAARFAKREAVVWGQERWSWSELEERAVSFAGALVELGVERGDRVALVSTNRPEALVAYFAAARIGAITAALGPSYTAAELNRLVELVEPAAVVALGRLGERELDAVLGELTLPEDAAVIAIGDDPAPAGALSFDELSRRECPRELAEKVERRRAAVEPDDGLLLVFTSGSTGEPRGALLSHRNVIANIEAEVRVLDLGPDDRILLHLPIHHVGGATELAVPPLLTGAAVVMMDHFRPDEALSLVEREGITLLGQVPAMFVMEFGLENYADFDLSSLRTVAVAGAAAPRRVFEQMLEMAPRVVTGYGLTEVAGFVTYTAPGDGLETLAQTVGRVVTEFELRVVDPEGRPLPEGEVGEVEIRGACVMLGYFRDPEATAEVLGPDGWLATGDLGHLDERGCLTLVDRKKEMFISGGYNVYPREIEEHLARHPKIALAACIGLPHEVLGEVGVAFVVPRPGAELDAEEVLDHCRGGLAEHKVPRSVEVRRELPMTALGKIDKRALRKAK